MVVTKMLGGLGNQMFQYAMGRSVQLRNNDVLKLDLNGYKYQYGVTPRKFELGIFAINYEVASQIDIANLVGFDFINRIFNQLGINLKVRSKYYIQEKSPRFDNRLLKVKGNVYLEGFWNTEMYFIAYDNQIRKDFVFKKDLVGKNKELAKEIESLESVSIHVRRGDYVKDKTTNKFHGTCGLGYYQKALGLINKKVKNPKYFVFSDDLEWVKDNLKIKNAVYVDGNIGDNSYIDMQLMSLCKHNVIANSTFSWWGAWLNSNPKKIVIAPKKWFNDPNIDTSNLIPEGWIKL